MSKSIILLGLSPFILLRAMLPLIRMQTLVMSFNSLLVPDIAVLIIFLIIIIAVVAAVILLYYFFLRESKGNS
ncbi:MAG: hypothetical protein ACFFC7_32230 [Candidatus Hermodarchaeota archaeon]